MNEFRGVKQTGSVCDPLTLNRKAGNHCAGILALRHAAAVQELAPPLPAGKFTAAPESLQCNISSMDIDDTYKED